MRARLARRIALSLGTAVVALVALEFGLRACAATAPGGSEPPPSAEWYRLDSQVGWAPNPGYRGEVYGVWREFGASGLTVRDEAQRSGPETRTVAIYGDSNSFGVTVPSDETFAEQLDAMLPDVRVLNLAVPGHSSFQGLRRLRATLDEIQPDVVVFSFNFNDRRYVLHRPPDAEAVGGASPSQLQRLHIYRLLRRFLRFTRGAPPAPDAEAPVRVDQLEPRVSPDEYRANLEAAAAFVAERGLPFLLILLGDNPTDTAFLGPAPPGSDGRARLEKAIAAENFFSDLARLRLVELLRSQGEAGLAEEWCVNPNPIPSMHGGAVVHADSTYHREMRAVAREHDLRLVDADATLRERPEVFVDFCHVSAEGHALIADLLLPVVEEALGQKDG